MAGAEHRGLEGLRHRAEREHRLHSERCPHPDRRRARCDLRQHRERRRIRQVATLRGVVRLLPAADDAHVADRGAPAYELGVHGPGALLPERHREDAAHLRLLGVGQRHGHGVDRRPSRRRLRRPLRSRRHPAPGEPSAARGDTDGHGEGGPRWWRRPHHLSDRGAASTRSPGCKRPRRRRSNTSPRRMSSKPPTCPLWAATARGRT